MRFLANATFSRSQKQHKARTLLAGKIMPGAVKLGGELLFPPLETKVLLSVGFLDDSKAKDGGPCISFSFCYSMLSCCLVLKTEGFKIPETVSSFLYIENFSTW